MIEKQREKEFLFELERLYYNYSLVISGSDYHGEMFLSDIDSKEMPEVTKKIERSIDRLKEKR